MPLIRTTFGKEFSQAEGQTVFEAALQAGIVLPYSCKSGRCSSCKCKVLSGESRHIRDELGLTEHEKEQGFILGCVRSATTDLLIAVEDIGSQIIPEAKTLPVRISKLDKLSPDVLLVKLRMPPSAKFSYLAGQHIEVIGSGGLRRSYSIANAPVLDKQLELHIRAVQGGAMSDYWFNQAKENDLLRINGPLGSFFARPLTGLYLVLLATGTGIAPVKAMLEMLANSPAIEQPISTTVYWGGRKPADLYYEFDRWHPTVRYVPVLSRAPAVWSGARGYVQKEMLRRDHDLVNTAVYACGSQAMVASAKADLTEAGLPEERFYSDVFVSSGT